MNLSGPTVHCQDLYRQVPVMHGTKACARLRLAEVKPEKQAEERSLRLLANVSSCCGLHTLEHTLLNILCSSSMKKVRSKPSTTVKCSVKSSAIATATMNMYAQLPQMCVRVRLTYSHAMTLWVDGSYNYCDLTAQGSSSHYAAKSQGN